MISRSMCLLNMIFHRKANARPVSVNIFFISVHKQKKKFKIVILHLVPYRIRTHDLSPRSTPLRHIGVSCSIVKLIYDIAFDKSAGLLEQQAHVKFHFVLIKGCAVYSNQ